MYREVSGRPMSFLNGWGKGMMNVLMSIGLGCSLGSMLSAAENNPEPDRLEVYKTIGDIQLKMHLFEPGGGVAERKSAIVFFFGGGWNGGSPNQFYPHCRYLADRGMLAMAAEYRVKSLHGTPPTECVKDGKSAIRWIRREAERLQVDPRRIAAGGGSAGGHVAAACATVVGFDSEPDSGISPIPDALVLFNPVYENGPGGYGYDRVKEYCYEISPLHNIREGIAPAIVFFGTEDNLVPVATTKRFQSLMRDVGARSELYLYEGQGHGFFNFGRSENRYFTDTVEKMDAFLVSLGLLEMP